MWQRWNVLHLIYLLNILLIDNNENCSLINTKKSNLMFLNMQTDNEIYKINLEKLITIDIYLRNILIYRHILTYRSAISQQLPAKCQTQTTCCSGHYNSFLLDLHLFFSSLNNNWFLPGVLLIFVYESPRGTVLIACNEKANTSLCHYKCHYRCLLIISCGWLECRLELIWKTVFVWRSSTSRTVWR